MIARFEPLRGWIFDSREGIYMGESVQSLAREFGWSGEFASRDSQYYLDAWTEAEEYLNSLLPEGYYFGYNDSGDFGLWKEDEGEEE
ncbi:hypothetical protein D6827_00590 [Candidatus Parcubacteria bacterium]|nr:MAG: hypothetical protein D6827_00590 [Candidatus Parcubacteria bacterium]